MKDGFLVIKHSFLDAIKPDIENMIVVLGLEETEETPDKGNRYTEMRFNPESIRHFDIPNLSLSDGQMTVVERYRSSGINSYQGNSFFVGRIPDISDREAVFGRFYEIEKCVSEIRGLTKRGGNYI